MSQQITLFSSDNQTFVVDIETANQMGTVKAVLQDCPDTDAVPISNVDGTILAKVLEYCKYKAAKKEATDNAWEKNYIQMSHDMLFPVISAANFLNIPSLLHLGCRDVAEQISCRTPDEVRQHFGGSNEPLTEEDFKKIIAENPWVEKFLYEEDPSDITTLPLPEEAVLPVEQTEQ